MWKYNNERFVVLDTGDIIDTCSWGCQGWGDSYQTHLEIEGNKVYVTYWTAGDYDYNDEFDKLFLGNIVYSSNKPFLVKESVLSRTPTITYDEYNLDLSDFIGEIRGNE